jgi:hypothetical protein
MRTEIEARNVDEACTMIADDIARIGIRESVNLAYEVIRDDNVYPPKDVHSRHTNGFAILRQLKSLT